jgi:hypothetical protein
MQCSNAMFEKDLIRKKLSIDVDYVGPLALDRVWIVHVVNFTFLLLATKLQPSTAEVCTCRQKEAQI